MLAGYLRGACSAKSLVLNGFDKITSCSPCIGTEPIAEQFSFGFYSTVSGRVRALSGLKVPFSSAALGVVALLRQRPDRRRHEEETMAEIERISVEQAHAKANQALLVCAYEDEAKCRMVNLYGSISLASFRSRAASLPKTQEIIFY
jgi:hypothetical protein